MAEHEMKLDDQKHRTIILGRELSGNPKYSVTVVFKELATGEKVNVISFKSLAPEKVFEDVEIVSREVKIPPDLG